MTPKPTPLHWPTRAMDEAQAAVHYASRSATFTGRKWVYPPYCEVPVRAKFSILDSIPDDWRDRIARVAVTPNDWPGMTARLAAEIEAMRAELDAQYARL